MDKRNEFIQSNLGLVHACARRFKGRGIDYDDLYQVGCLGLLKAYDNFDKNKGFQFSTYAVPVILGEIKRLFRNEGTIKVGRSLKELSLRANRECDKFCAENGRSPTVNELSKLLNTTPNKTVEALEAGRIPLSLSLADRDDEESAQLDIPVDGSYERLSDLIALKQVILELTPKDRSLIIMRFFDNKTQGEIAKILNMTQVQVSRRQKKILEKLKIKLE